MKKIIIFYIWALITLVLFSCTEDKINPEATGYIKGQVIDDGSDEGIYEVQITTNPATETFLSNDSGYFVLHDLDIGDYTVAFKKVGYRSESVNVEVNEEDTTTIKVIMNRNSDFNKAPVIRNNPVPAAGEKNQPVNITLKWSAYDSNFDDSLTYDLTLYNSEDASSATVHADLSDTTFLMEGLQYNTTYFWQISATDGMAEVKSTIWSFKTVDFPDNPFVYIKMDGGSYEIFSGDSAEQNAVQLTYNNQNDWYPKTGPYGNKIAYASLYNLEPHIYTMDKDGENRRRVTFMPVSGYFNNGVGFCWSSNGSSLYYPHNDILYRVNNDGTGTTQIANAPEGRNFRIINSSHNGEMLVAQTIGARMTNGEIYLMKVNGKDTVLLVEDLPGIIDYPSFSPDDSKILYTHDISGNLVPDGRQLNTHIFTIDIETGEKTDLSTDKPEGTLDIQPAYSPDGAKIIFVNTSNTGNGERSIWMMDTDGKNRILLVPDAQMPQWW